MDSLPETYNDPKFYMTIVSNFSWVFYKVVPREVEDNGCAFFSFYFFGGGGGVHNMDYGLGEENSEYGQNELGLIWQSEQDSL